MLFALIFLKVENYKLEEQNYKQKMHWDSVKIKP